MMSNEVNIVAGRATKYLAEKIALSYGQELGNIKITEFSDGEFQPSFEENIRGNDIFIIQSTFPPSDNLFELMMMIDAAKRASARNIVAVIPYFGFARQDRKDRPRVSIASKLIANLLSAAGVNRIITIDLHADQIQGFFECPVDHLFASSIFVPYLKALNLPRISMASPDTGGTKRAASYAKVLETDFIICYKQRAKPNAVSTMAVVGEVEGKDIILVDDIIDTAGSITKAARLMMDKGANSVRAVATHPIFSGDAYERIEDSPFEEVYVTDTIPLKRHSDKVKVISTADLFGEVIRRVRHDESISSIFRFENLKKQNKLL
ncbi:MAG: ribose-phosphate pyrophosphokinase [Bacteroidales bacterium]|nr:ribose-phosphate pyrophosphokinase [Bacteroidales bacterium]